MNHLIQASLWIAILSGTLYCAVEPFVRRWWSEIFISWSRLLVGDFRDPMVGRDILVGALLGLVSNLLYDKLGLFVTEKMLGIQVADTSNHGISNALIALVGFPGASFVYGSLNSLFILTIPVAFYFVFRHKKAAIAVLFVLLVSLNIVDLPYQLWLLFVLVLLKNILQLVSLVRFGLLAMIACLVFPDIGSGHAMTFDTSSILFPNAIVQLTLLIGIATYAAYISVGGAKAFSEKSFWGD